MPGHHTPTQKRQARHIERSERRRGLSERRAKSIAWATINKRRNRNRRKR